MKIFFGSLIIILSLLSGFGCTGKRGEQKNISPVNESISVPDTGFTGIKQYMSGSHLVMETTLKNGVKNGLLKTYYANGKLRRTYWYENGLREDSSLWYYEEGQVFQTTPYNRDTLDGIRKQYFRNGKVKARIGYQKGLRNLYFEEFTQDGKLVTSYPLLVVKFKDDYNSRGVYRVSLELSDKSDKVRYYRGDLGSGVFDTTRCIKIKTTAGVGILELKKSGVPQSGSVDVIAEILTNYGNNYLVHKKIELPYKDLN
jgi:hypothetical protein